MPCIYQIRNVVNNKIYVGSTQRPKTTERKSQHFFQLRNNTHCNKKLQNSFNKHGIESFVFEVLEEFSFPESYSKEYINEYILGREMFYITLLKPFYNICLVTASHKLGRKCSEEVKKVLSLKNKGRKQTPEVVEKIRKASTGRVVSQETRDKLSASNSGKNSPNFGKPCPDYIKQIISERNKACYKNGTGLYSKESREKQKQTQKQKWSNSDVVLQAKIRRRKQMAKQFYCYKNGELIGEFLNQTEAVEVLKVPSQSGISLVLNNKSKSYKDYFFTYTKLS